MVLITGRIIATPGFPNFSQSDVSPERVTPEAIYPHTQTNQSSRPSGRERPRARRPNFRKSEGDEGGGPGARTRERRGGVCEDTYWDT